MNEDHWYLELSEEIGSHKFYEVTVEGTELIILYGRIGDNGQTQKKSFESSEKARAEADKRLREKRKQGYVDSEKGMRPKRPVERNRISTPKPPVDIAKLVPGLKQLAKITVRLHPRRGQTNLEHSKIGGDILWPDEENWPHCEEHDSPYTPILQLRAEDVPELGFPVGKNLFQLLWCPNDHEKGYAPTVKIYWRNIAEVGTPRVSMPVSKQLKEFTSYIPKTCVLAPERVIEYPDPMELDEHYPDLMKQIEVLEHPKILKYLEDEDIFDAISTVYQYLLSTADGTKVGGYPQWIQGPDVPTCTCNQKTEYLLTISSLEFDSGTWVRWGASDSEACWNMPYEERNLLQAAPDIVLGDAGNINVFICRSCPDWPVYSVFQCS